MSDAERFMEAALQEAAKGLGLTSPNPPVGAVVAKGRRIVATGFHRRAGGPHAEVVALRAAGGEARRATLYITLEPCSTSGRTPPCTGAIIEAGIRRVVYATTDPNPSHAGRADRLLRQHGIEVRRGVLKARADQLIRPWAQWVTAGRPWVVAKAGSSLDGRLTRPPGESQWLTSAAARADAQQLRRRCDAILIGAGTLRADDPSLTVRGKAARGKTQPWRVVFAGRGRISRQAKLFTDAHADRTIIYRNRSVGEVLGQLGQRGVTSVLIEGGGTLLGEAFAAGLVNEAHFYFAPILCGGETVPTIARPLSSAVQLDEVEVTPIGDNTKISGLVRPQ